MLEWQLLPKQFLKNPHNQLKTLSMHQEKCWWHYGASGPCAAYPWSIVICSLFKVPIQILQIISTSCNAKFMIMKFSTHHMWSTRSIFHGLSSKTAYSSPFLSQGKNQGGKCVCVCLCVYWLCKLLFLPKQQNICLSILIFWAIAL